MNVCPSLFSFVSQLVTPARWLAFFCALMLLAPVAVTLKASEPSPAALTRALIEKIEIEDIRLQDADLKAVLAHLEQVLDVHVPEDLRINLTLADEAAADRAVNLVLRSVNFRELLDFISLQTDTAYRLQGSSVIFGGPADPDGTLETVFIPVTRGAVIRMTGAQ